MDMSILRGKYFNSQGLICSGGSESFWNQWKDIFYKIVTGIRLKDMTMDSLFSSE